MQGKVYIYFGSGKDRKWTQKPDIILTCRVKLIFFQPSLLEDNKNWPVIIEKVNDF